MACYRPSEAFSDEAFDALRLDQTLNKAFRFIQGLFGFLKE